MKDNKRPIFIALGRNIFSDLHLQGLLKQSEASNLLIDIFWKLDYIQKDRLARTLVITQDFLKGEWFEQYIKLALDFFKAQGVDTVIEVRKRLSRYQERYRVSKNSSAPEHIKREFFLRDPKQGKKEEQGSLKMYKTMCIFFEFPT